MRGRSSLMALSFEIQIKILFCQFFANYQELESVPIEPFRAGHRSRAGHPESGFQMDRRWYLRLPRPFPNNPYKFLTFLINSGRLNSPSHY